MVERRVCTFCGSEIEPGTGRMFIKKDGTVSNFCTSKCFKNLIQLGRVPRRTTWTRYYEREKQIRMKGAPAPEAEAPKARKVRKGEAKPDEKKEETKQLPKADKPKAEEKAATPEEPAKKVPAKKTEEPKSTTAEKKPEVRRVAKPKPKVEPKEKPSEGGKT
jgi:large subunit ribosomal protein L24e